MQAEAALLYFLLIYRPKLSQAFENFSIVSCILHSELVLRAKSSAKRKSLTVVTVTFVFACSLMMLKINQFYR